MKDFCVVLLECEKNVAKLLIKKIDNKEDFDDLDYKLLREVLDVFLHVHFNKGDK